MKRKILVLVLLIAFAVQGKVTTKAEVYNGYLEYEITENDKVAIVGITREYEEDLIKDVVIPETIDGKTVTTIKGYAFSYIDGPETIQIPKTVSLIEDRALNSSYNCEKFIVSEDNDFYCSDETGMIYNKDMTELIAFPAAVQGEIVIPDSVKKIRPRVFEYCKITKVRLPANLKDIPYGYSEDDIPNIFYGCWELMEYDISNKNVSFSVVDGILYDKSQGKVISCPSAKKGVINIPESVKTIGYYAFSGVNAEINLPEGLTTLEVAAFANSNINSISIPASVTSMGKHPFHSCDYLSTVTVDPDNENYCVVDNILYTKDMKTLIQCPGGVGGIITIPDGVKEIDNGAFQYNQKLKEIYLPKGITSIGAVAFNDCRVLEKIVVSEGLKKLEWGVFSCNRLKEIILPQSIEGVDRKDVFGNNATLYVVENSFMHQWAQENWNNYSVLSTVMCEEHIYDDWTVLVEASCVPGVKGRMCTVCGLYCKETEEIPATGEHSGEWMEIEEATCGKDGNKERECEVCGYIECEEIPATGNHTYSEWSVTKQPTSDKTGLRTRKCTVCDKEETEEIPATGNSEETKPDKEEETGGGTTGTEESKKPGQSQTTDTQKPEQSQTTDTQKPGQPEATEQPAVEYKKGTDFNKGNDSYEVVSVDGNKGTVAYTGTATKNKKTITVPQTVTVEGKTFTVTEIADNAFKSNTKVTSITVSANITKIGKNSFSGCKNLKKITIKSTNLKKVGKNAFKGIHKKAVIKVPKKQLTKYKKLLKGKGQPKTVKIK